MNSSHTAIRHLEEALLAADVRDCDVCLALSGGMDSVALLGAFQALAHKHGLVLTALHVNHGLSPNAGDWEKFCAALCARLGVALSIEKVEVARDAGLGIEAAARLARYQVFARQRAGFVALAHHLDDQVETFMIQLLRGAGAKGLAAMPALRAPWRDGPRLLRPWLQLSRSAIEDYARSLALDWVEDESNDDHALDRNYLRHRVLPAIAERFPAYRGTIARSVRNLADAAVLADMLAQLDHGAAAAGNEGLQLAVLGALPLPRALNLLRYLFVRAGAELPRRVALEEALRQCLQARNDAQVRVDSGAFSLRRFRNRVFLVENLALPEGWRARWQGESHLWLPAGYGRLMFERAQGEGLSVDKLSAGAVTVRFREGGERMALAQDRPHRHLRHLFQEFAIAPWLRERAPLLFCDERLAYVSGIGAAAEFKARPDEPSLLLKWDSAGKVEEGAC